MCAQLLLRWWKQRCSGWMMCRWCIEECGGLLRRFMTSLGVLSSGASEVQGVAAMEAQQAEQALALVLEAAMHKVTKLGHGCPCIAWCRALLLEAAVLMEFPLACMCWAV